MGNAKVFTVATITERPVTQTDIAVERLEKFTVNGTGPEVVPAATSACMARLRSLWQVPIGQLGYGQFISPGHPGADKR